MYDRIQSFSEEEKTKIHDTSIKILSTLGVAFNDSEALHTFRKNGLKVEGNVVRLSEIDVRRAVESAPSTFVVRARDPKKSIRIGAEDLVFAPGFGAPFVVNGGCEQREATMADYDNFCKLVQTSTQIDMNGFMLVAPKDVVPETAHLDMLFSNIVLCDKAYMGSPVSRQCSQDCIEMAGIVWGGRDKVEQTPVMISLINSLSPLQFSEKMAGSLIVMARWGQPVAVSSLIRAGSSGPVPLAGVLALQNAEILAGLTLAQLVHPGAPVIYGSTSSSVDMRSGVLSIGAPELSAMVSATAQMARFYNLPSCSGGGLTDAHFPDAQAGAESAMALLTAVRSGINFVWHSCGILDSYISMSFEKFIVDEEICGAIRKLVKPIEITDDTIDLKTIREAGIGGQYPTRLKTLPLCRTEFYLPKVMHRRIHRNWQGAGTKRIDETASDAVANRLATYEKPDIDPEIESDLFDFVTRRKNR